MEKVIVTEMNYVENTTENVIERRTTWARLNIVRCADTNPLPNRILKY